MTSVSFQDAQVVSRDQLMAAAAAVTQRGPEALAGGEHGEVGVAAAFIVGSPGAYVVSTLVTERSVRRVEVWMSEVGVVALPTQETSDAPSPFISLPPFFAYETLVSSVAFRADMPAAEASSTYDGVRRLADLVVQGGHDVTAMYTLDWLAGSETSRWVLVDTSTGRVGTFAAPADNHSQFTAEPQSPMAIASAISDRVGRAVAPASQTPPP
jgi:hypothetical protein